MHDHACKSVHACMLACVLTYHDYFHACAHGMHTSVQTRAHTHLHIRTHRTHPLQDTNLHPLQVMQSDFMLNNIISMGGFNKVRLLVVQVALI